VILGMALIGIKKETAPLPSHAENVDEPNL
jgi:hypothetical protein